MTTTVDRRPSAELNTRVEHLHAIASVASSMDQPTDLSLQMESGAQRLDVRRGDLLIANRLSSTQAVMNVSKDPWTHAALVGEVDGELAAIELGPRGCGARPLDVFADAYRIVGVARPRMHEHCIDAVASMAEHHRAAGQITYSWETCRVLESVALARCFAPARMEPVVIAGAEAWARRLVRREPSDAMTCAGFVDMCLAAACPKCRPRPVWPRRARSPLWRGMPSVIDLWRGRLGTRVSDPAVVRAMSTPADLWLAECWQHRIVHRPHRTTVIVDLTTERSEA